MRRPISGSDRVKPRDNQAASQLQSAGQQGVDYAEKLKLATSLHEQGVNPLRWQEAEPAPYDEQQRYRQTRQLMPHMFAVNDRIYRRTSQLAATPAQGQDALDVYLGSQPKSVSDLVPVDQVQLRHPMNNKLDTPPAGADALERYRRFAKLGIDPNRAHEGDAIPHHLQDGLKRATAGVLRSIRSSKIS